MASPVSSYTANNAAAFTPGQTYTAGVAGVASPIHMGSLLQGSALATPSVPGRIGGQALAVPQTPIMGMMNGMMGNFVPSYPYNAVSSRSRGVAMVTSS